MGYFQVRYNSRVVNYDRRGFIRLATDVTKQILAKSFAESDHSAWMHQWQY